VPTFSGETSRYPVGVGVVRDAWLYRMDLAGLRAQTVRASQITSPSQITAGTPATITIVANLTATLDSTKSVLAAYVNDAASAASTTAWSRSCGTSTCTFTGTIPASATSGQCGNLVWHAFLLGGGHSLHTVGHATVGP
jgi:hypothetical protein